MKQNLRKNATSAKNEKNEKKNELRMQQIMKNSTPNFFLIFSQVTFPLSISSCLAGNHARENYYLCHITFCQSFHIRTKTIHIKIYNHLLWHTLILFDLMICCDLFLLFISALFDSLILFVKCVLCLCVWFWLWPQWAFVVLLIVTQRKESRMCKKKNQTNVNL